MSTLWKCDDCGSTEGEVFGVFNDKFELCGNCLVDRVEAMQNMLEDIGRWQNNWDFRNKK